MDYYTYTIRSAVIGIIYNNCIEILNTIDLSYVKNLSGGSEVKEELVLRPQKVDQGSS